MKGGRVVRVRVNPPDCMAVLDVCAVLGITSQARFSFDQLVSIALKSLLEAARGHGTIPKREGFEYIKMMEPYMERVPGQDRARKLQLTSLMQDRDVKAVTTDIERERRLRRYEELRLRKEADPLNFSEQDQAEFTPLVDEFFQ